MPVSLPHDTMQNSSLLTQGYSSSSHIFTVVHQATSSSNITFPKLLFKLSYTPTRFLSFFFSCWHILVFGALNEIPFQRGYNAMKAFLKFFVANFPEKVEKKSDLTDSGKEKDWEQDTEQNLRAQSSSASHHVSKKGTRSSHLFCLNPSTTILSNRWLTG